ncbi:MAG TPA: LptF/LptG family permease, partial [Candidatus Saccharicenans sp.]|nr:LptF/LptG family permease [Candidatus Saccharicenans sp.]
LCLVTMSFTFWLAPRANYKWLQTMVESVLTRVNFQLVPRQFNESFPSNVIYIDGQDSPGKWQGIFLYRKEEQEEVQVVTAREGEMWPAPDLKSAWLRLTDGYSFRFNLSQPETIAFDQFKRQEQLVDLKNLLPPVSLEKKYREKSLAELLADQRKVKADRNKNRGELLAIQVELNKRVSLPAACLVFVFLGVGLGWRRWPGGRVGGYGVSLIILVIYYFLLVFGQSQAEAGRLAPSLGLWLPDFLALVAGWLSYLSACREVEIRFCPRIKSLANVSKKRARNFTASSTRAQKRSSYQVFSLSFHDRYILSKFVPIYAYLFLALVLVLVVFNFLTRWEMARENQQPFYLLLSFIWHKLPEFTNQAMQLSALLAPILCLNFLYRRNEIQALITSGLSFWRLTMPILVVAILLIPLSFFLQDRLVVRGNLEAEKIWSQLASRPVRAFTFQNRYWIKNDDLPGFLHYELSSAERNSLHRLLVFQIEEGTCFKLKRIIFS